MQITRTSILSGKVSTREIDINTDQLSRWSAGELIQNVMPHLSEDDREFLISGITPEEWSAIFGDDDDGED